MRDASARARYLDDVCGGDRALHAEVDAMLAAHADGSQFGEVPLNVPMAHTARLASGVMIGPYRIDQLIGVGGMGQVYRARDTKLGRDVAVKILPASLAREPEPVRRFDREGRLLAALNHPHIAAIYGLENFDGVAALVLELVEGRTLADCLAAGPLPVQQALSIGRDIADALDAAHEKGIVHRDLKPTNIKITPDGTVKVLDFGVAKVFSGDRQGLDLSPMPSVTIEGTREGTIIGTPAYMSAPRVC
jgi:serine/threonine-protein kinase